MPEFKTRALYDRVIIQPEIPAPVMIGAFEIPATVDSEPDRGLVMSIGPGTIEEPTDVKSGDRVIFVKHAAEKISIDGADYLLLHEEDLIAIIP